MSPDRHNRPLCNSWKPKSHSRDSFSSSSHVLWDTKSSLTPKDRRLVFKLSENFFNSRPLARRLNVEYNRANSGSIFPSIVVLRLTCRCKLPLTENGKNSTKTELLNSKLATPTNLKKKTRQLSWLIWYSRHVHTMTRRITMIFNSPLCSVRRGLCGLFNFVSFSVLQLVTKFWNTRKMPDLYFPDSMASAFPGPAACDGNLPGWPNMEASIGRETLLDQISSYLRDSSELQVEVCTEYAANENGLLAAQSYTGVAIDGGLASNDSLDLVSDSSTDFTQTVFAVEKSLQLPPQPQEANRPISCSSPSSTAPPSPQPTIAVRPFANISTSGSTHVTTVGRDTNPTSSSSMFFSLDKKPTNAEERRLRKKELNRRAAMRCRQRKVERERELEEMVRRLQQRNAEVEQELDDLTSHLASVERTIIQHVMTGCTTFLTKKANVWKHQGTQSTNAQERCFSPSFSRVRSPLL